ncbi:MAG: Crp/Fnr family transcriptional regulator [Pygmaiobacter massiliensis]|nr:Crp/Fnr family transcriptional regulator [Pygmaiobacter massiliensis]
MQEKMPMYKEMALKLQAFETCPLFEGFTPKQISALLLLLQAQQKTLEKGQTLYHAGHKAPALGLVLFGTLQLENDDVWGNHSILGQVTGGQIFAETYAFLPDEPMQVSVRALQKTEVLLLWPRAVLKKGKSQLTARFVENLLFLCAQKNLALSRRVFHTAGRSIRQKLLAYLSFKAQQLGSQQFCIPFNRQQLADYLGVDRSALSAELGRMQADGLLKTKGSYFWLNTKTL